MPFFRLVGMSKDVSLDPSYSVSLLTFPWLLTVFIHLYGKQKLSYRVYWLMSWGDENLGICLVTLSIYDEFISSWRNRGCGLKRLLNHDGWTEEQGQNLTVWFMSQSFKLPPFFLDHDFSYCAEDDQKQSFTKECQGSVQSDSMGIKIHC